MEFHLKQVQIIGQNETLIGILLFPVTKEEKRDYQLFRWRLKNRFPDVINALNAIAYDIPLERINYVEPEKNGELNDLNDPPEGDQDEQMDFEEMLNEIPHYICQIFKDKRIELKKDTVSAFDFKIR